MVAASSNQACLGLLEFHLTDMDLLISSVFILGVWLYLRCSGKASNQLVRVLSSSATNIFHSDKTDCGCKLTYF